MPANKHVRIRSIALCLIMLGLATLACATFRAPGDPAPTRPPNVTTPTMTPTPTATLTDTPAPAPSLTPTRILTLTPAPPRSSTPSANAPGQGPNPNTPISVSHTPADSN